MDRMTLFLILDMIYKHKTVKSLIHKGVFLEEMAEEIWIATDKGYIQETPTGFKLTSRGIDQYMHLRLLYAKGSEVVARVHKTTLEGSDSTLWMAVM
jgi:hypothetical protein